jgi:hypothetical protein
MLELTPVNYRTEVELSRDPILICVHDSESHPPEGLEQLCGRELKCYGLDGQRYEEMAKSLRVLSLPSAIVLDKGSVVQRIHGERTVGDFARILDLN